MRVAPLVRLAALTRSLWDRVTEPRHMKLIYLGVYALTLIGGVAALTAPPPTIVWEAGPALLAVWGWLFIVAGIAGMITVLPGWWWVERLLAIAPASIALAVYVILDAGSPGWAPASIVVAVLAGIVFLIRFVTIRGFSYEPPVR